MPAAAIRKSSRVRSAPQRLRPNSDLPAQMQDMIHEAAVSCAAKSAIKFEPAAVNALEEALEPIFQSIMEAAMVPSCSPSSCLVDELAATATAAVAAAAALLVAPAVVMSTTGALLVCLLLQIEAVKKGRDEVTAADLETVRKRIPKKKKS